MIMNNFFKKEGTGHLYNKHSSSYNGRKVKVCNNRVTYIVVKLPFVDSNHVVISPVLAQLRKPAY